MLVRNVVVLLQKFDTGRVPFSQPVDVDTGTDTTARSPTVSVLPPTTSRAARPADQVRVVVANASDIDGLAGRTTTFLTNNGYNALSPMDASRAMDNSQVLYRADFEPEARTIAQLLGLPGSAVKALDDNAPVPDTRGADVVVAAGGDVRLPGDTTSTTRRS